MIKVKELLRVSIMIKVKELLDIFKRKKVEKVTLSFSAGNDNFNGFMLDYVICSGKISKDNPFSDDEFSCIEEFILENVKFYETASNTYIGEYGNIIIDVRRDKIVISKVGNFLESQVITKVISSPTLTDEEINLLEGLDYITTADGAFFYKEGLVYQDKNLEKSILEKVKNTYEEICREALKNQIIVYGYSADIFKKKIVISVACARDKGTGERKQYEFK